MALESWLGVTGRERLREGLASSNPLDYIVTFQEQTSLATQASRAALPMLDLLGVSRSTVYVSLVTQLRDKLLSRLSTLSPESLDLMLEEVFPYISLPELRDVGLAVLGQHAAIPKKFLLAIERTKGLLDACPWSVKQQVWTSNEKLFSKTILPQLQALTSPEAVAAATATRRAGLSPRERRERGSVRQLVLCVGGSVRLYNIVLATLRSLFVNAPAQLCFCELRAGLLMALHDAEVSAIYSLDPCHKFAWALAACVRDGNVTAERGAELGALLAATEPGPVIGDLGMVVLDPYATQTLVAALYARLGVLFSQRQLPRTDSESQTLLQLLHLGVGASAVLSRQTHADIALPPSLAGAFLPAVMELLLDDAIAQLDPQAGRNLAVINTVILAHAQQFFYCRKLVQTYVLEALARRHLGAAQQLCEMLADHLLAVVAAHDEAFVESLCQRLAQLVLHSEPPLEPVLELVAGIVRVLLAPLAPLSVVAHECTLQLLLDLRPRASAQLVEPLVTFVLSCCVSMSEDDDLPPALKSVYGRLRAEFATVPGVAQTQRTDRLQKQPSVSAEGMAQAPRFENEDEEREERHHHEEETYGDEYEFGNSPQRDFGEGMQVDDGYNPPYERSASYPEPGEGPGSPTIGDGGAMDDDEDW